MHLEQVRDAREQLRIDGEAAVEAIPGARNQAHGKLVLEHDDGCAEGRAVRQQLEGERGGDLVGDVGHAHIEVGQLRLHHVTLHHLPARHARTHSLTPHDRHCQVQLFACRRMRGAHRQA